MIIESNKEIKAEPQRGDIISPFQGFAINDLAFLSIRISYSARQFAMASILK